MSIASGASARFVIVALEASMKKRTPENRPMPSVTPASEASVRRGLWSRSRQTYLSTRGPGPSASLRIAGRPSTHTPVQHADGSIQSASHRGSWVTSTSVEPAARCAWSNRSTTGARFPCRASPWAHRR